jgi:hypothetical protein
VSPHPKLRSDLVLVEQTYRGEQSYIVKDPQSRKYFRFRPLEVMVMQQFDGRHTAADAAAALLEEGVKISAGAVQTFVGKLNTMGLCERTLREQSVLLMERLRAERRRRLGQGVFKGDLLRLRWSVGDPDKLFDRWLPRLRFFFSRTFLAISVALFAVYFLVLALKWPDFFAGMYNLYTLNIDVGDFAVFWLTGTVIIIIHELGHGLTCKYFGGQVHEIGAMLIYFQTAFFCNVNDAWTFPELRARLWVTAAGSWIQLVIASLGAIVWWAAAPGTVVSDIAFAAVFVGGITTVFMNVNPLIPLDGYYALSDYLEIPNLRQRAFGYLAWLVKTRVFHLSLPAPPGDERELRIFRIYGALAAGYIGLILAFFAATAFGRLSEWFGAIGVAIFLGGLVVMLYRPLSRWIHTARTALREQRAAWRGGPPRRRIAAAGVGFILLGALIPWPITITGPFVAAPVLSIPHTAPDSGIVQRVQVLEGTRVTAGAPLLRIRNLELERELAGQQRITDSLAVRSAQARGRERTSETAQIDAARSVEDARLAGLRERVEALHIRALGTGTVLTPRPEELVGRWVSNGEILLQLGRSDSVEIRIALNGAGGTLVQAGHPVRLLQDATFDVPVSARIADVAAAIDSGQTLTARLRLAAGASWRPGMTGRARITLERSNVWGALWWTLRRGVRSDILL